MIKEQVLELVDELPLSNNDLQAISAVILNKTGKKELFRFVNDLNPGTRSRIRAALILLDPKMGDLNEQHTG